jgi:acyl carrier protein
MADTLFAKLVDMTLDTASIQIDRSAITHDTSFSHLGIDSMGMLSILLKLEDAFGVSLEDMGEELEAPETIGQLENMVEEYRKKREKLN